MFKSKLFTGSKGIHKQSSGFFHLKIHIRIRKKKWFDNK